jgi:hypothetical protein
MELDTSDLVPSLKYLTENKKNSASKYKPLILTLLTHIETDKNYKLFHSDYMKIQDKYKALHKLLKKFISNYIEKVDNQYKLKKLLIDSEDASINIKRKTDAEEIINYGIFFPMIPTFRTLDKFIIKYEELFKQIDEKYEYIKQKYNEHQEQGKTKKLGIFPTIPNNDFNLKIGVSHNNQLIIKDNIKLYFLKFIYLFEKYIDAIKLGKLKIITFDDLNKIIDLLTTFIVLYNNDTKFKDNRYEELFIIISLFYNDNNKELFIDKKIFGNSKTNTPSIQIIYDDLKSIYKSTPTKTITLAEKLEKEQEFTEKQKTITDAAKAKEKEAIARASDAENAFAKVNTIAERAIAETEEAQAAAYRIKLAAEAAKSKADAAVAEARIITKEARQLDTTRQIEAKKAVAAARSEAERAVTEAKQRADAEIAEARREAERVITEARKEAVAEAEAAVGEARREAEEAKQRANGAETARLRAVEEAEAAVEARREAEAARLRAEEGEARLKAVAEAEAGEAIRRQQEEAQVEREAQAEREARRRQQEEAQAILKERRQQEEAAREAQARQRAAEATRQQEEEARRRQIAENERRIDFSLQLFIKYLQQQGVLSVIFPYASNVMVHISGKPQGLYTFILNTSYISSVLLRINDVYYVHNSNNGHGYMQPVKLSDIKIYSVTSNLIYTSYFIININGGIGIGNYSANSIKIDLTTGAQIYNGGDPDVLTEMDKLLIELEEFKEPIYEAIILKEIMNISENEPETTENLLLPIQMPRLVKKLGKLNSKLNFFNGIVKKLKEKQIISSKELESFNNIENKIKNLDISPDEEKSRQEILVYIEKTKKQLEQQNINIKDANIIDTTKVLVNFKKVADIIKLILIGLTVICIIIYIVVLLISIYNLINLLLKVIISIIYLFYNTAITNNDTLSYTTKRIIKCTKDNYADDIFNVLNEQLTALSIFNTNLYIIYILLGYVIVYLLYFIYTSIFAKYFLLVGTIKDIDPNFTLLTIIAIIFISSFVHLLIYKFLFKSICLNKFKEINVYEENIDNQFKNILSSFDQDDEYNTKFYNILTDTTKRSEIDTIFQNKVLELQDDTKNNLTQFLLIYDIYIYFEEFIYINDKKREDIKKYFDELNKGNIPPYSFISFLDINERKLIKPYHEDLPFYKQIPIDKIETYKKINDTIGDLLANINKSIIKYSGTFYPFLFTCIYIIIICIYNFVCVYLILSFISGSKNEELFPPFIYTMADKFMDVSRIIYNLFNK